MKNKPAREAIIYVPGLTHAGERDKSIEGFSYRIKKAIDVNYPEGRYKFSLEIQKKSFGKDNKLECKVATIFRLEEDSKLAICDIYELDYTGELTSKFEKQNVFFKTLWLFNALISKFPRLLFVTLHSGIKGISLKDKVQTFIVSLILFCLSAYGIILISALIAAIGSKIDFGNLPDFNSLVVLPEIKWPYFIQVSIDFIKDVIGYIFSWITGIIITIANIIHGYKKYIISSAAAILLFLPNFKNFITNSATDYLCLINYFNIGDRRLTIIGKFEELLEHIEEQGLNYCNMSVYSYSFGAIVTLDALFPYDGKTSERIKTKIKTLVTIGCPFDFIRVYWPQYFKHRKKSNIELDYWYNVHSGTDVLSSNFRNDEAGEEAVITVAEGSILPINISYNVIAPENVSFVNMMMLVGLRAHAMYWDDSEYSASCFTNLFQEMRIREINKIRKSQLINSMSNP